MKILLPGVEQEPHPAWWVGKEATCRQCHVLVELEDDDVFVEEIREPTFGGRRFVRAECPTDYCEGALELLDVSDSPLAPGEFNPAPAKP